jgi:Arc/MetJ-type ribon-helix-helix transcriptional regulator
MIDELLTSLDDIRESIRSVFEGREVLEYPLIPNILKVSTAALDSISRVLSDVLQDIRSEIERSTTKGASSVVSVRISDDDLKLIDMLVNVGVFRSRSEAVTFFVRRGIKASEELLNKIKEKIDELSRLRTELEKEFKKS